MSRLTLSRTKALAKPPTSPTCDGHCQSRTQSPPHFDSFSETTLFSLPNLVIKPHSNMAELKDYIAEAFKNVHATLQLAHGSEQRTLSEVQAALQDNNNRISTKTASGFITSS